MPIHDWSRVDAATFHNFHYYWVGELGRTLNDGLLPRNCYAMVEQYAGRIEADVLTLELSDQRGFEPPTDGSGGLLLADAPPKVARREVFDAAAAYAARSRSVVIRHTSGREVIAVIEIVSPGNKSSEARFRQFVRKIRWLIDGGIHVLLVDLHPPGSFDPMGLHNAIVAELGGGNDEPPPDRPLTLASYRADRPPEAFIEPTAVGLALTPMPLFLTVERYVNVPLEETYRAAWRGMPAVVRADIDGRSGT
jgi:hypothetical protein